MELTFIIDSLLNTRDVPVPTTSLIGGGRYETMRGYFPSDGLYHDLITGVYDERVIRQIEDGIDQWEFPLPQDTSLTMVGGEHPGISITQSFYAVTREKRGVIDRIRSSKPYQGYFNATSIGDNHWQTLTSVMDGQGTWLVLDIIQDAYHQITRKIGYRVIDPDGFTKHFSPSDQVLFPAGRTPGRALSKSPGHYQGEYFPHWKALLNWVDATGHY
jgi:hypothetical protein